MSASATVTDLPNRRKTVLLRLDPKLYNVLGRWAADDFRSTNAHIEYLLRKAAVEAGRITPARRGQPRIRRA